MIEIYTDGACSGNPGPGGWAYIKLVDKREVSRCFGSEADTTNNRMEIMAVLRGISDHPNLNDDLIIYSDSAYVVNTINNGWLNNWINKGIQKANMDLWIEIHKLWHPNYKIIKVPGHQDNEYNNECDKLAVQARLQVV